MESLFGKIKWFAGFDKSFGALAFRRILRNIILGCGEVIPEIKGSNVAQTDKESKESGFENVTVDLTTKQSCKGTVIEQSEMIDGEILDLPDDDDFHFELPDETPEEDFFT